MKNKVKYLSGLIAVVLFMLALTACSSDKDTGDTSSNSEVKEVATENVSSVDASSEVSSETVSSIPTSSEQTSSEAVTSKEMSSQVVSSDKQPVSSKASSSSQTQSSVKDKPTNPKPTSSKPIQKPASNESPNFGERMVEDEVDRIIAEGIAYAESKGMTWKDDYTVEGSGYYNPAFSGAGAEIFKRDLFYHIDQLYEINITDNYYVDGNSIYYKVVKGEFEEPGYWYGFVLY